MVVVPTQLKNAEFLEALKCSIKNGSQKSALTDSVRHILIKLASFKISILSCYF